MTENERRLRNDYERMDLDQNNVSDRTPPKICR